MQQSVVAVSLNPKHTFSKMPTSTIDLIEGKGVRGDAHCGETVQHVYLRRKNPTAPNRMQVHLLPAELFLWLAEQDHAVSAGQLGENIATSGIGLSQLPFATRLHLGDEAVIELTGLRTPCKQIEAFQPGLLRLLLDWTAPPKRRSLAGVMAVVLRSGSVQAGQRVGIELPHGSPQPLEHI